MGREGERKGGEDRATERQKSEDSRSLGQAMARAGQPQQLGQRVQKVQDLGDEEEEQGLAEVAQDAHHGKGHTSKVTKGVPHEHPRGEPVEERGRGGKRTRKSSNYFLSFRVWGVVALRGEEGETNQLWKSRPKVTAMKGIMKSSENMWLSWKAPGSSSTLWMTTAQAMTRDCTGAMEDAHFRRQTHTKKTNQHDSTRTQAPRTRKQTNTKRDLPSLQAIDSRENVDRVGAKDGEGAHVDFVQNACA